MEDTDRWLNNVHFMCAVIAASMAATWAAMNTAAANTWHLTVRRYTGGSTAARMEGKKNGKKQNNARME